MAAGPCEKQIPNQSSKRDPEVGQSLKLRAHMGIQNPLHRRGINYCRFARLLFHLSRHLCGHQRRHPCWPSDPDIAFLASQAKHQRLGACPVDQRAPLLLDRQLAFLSLVNCQSGAGFEVAVGSAAAAAASEALLLEIAAKRFHLQTLETRNSDGLDFLDVAVWSIRAALEAAFAAGQAASR